MARKRKPLRQQKSDVRELEFKLTGSNLHDYFAGCALTGLLSHGGPPTNIDEVKDLADTAYGLADEMMETRDAEIEEEEGE